MKEMPDVLKQYLQSRGYDPDEFQYAGDESLSDGAAGAAIGGLLGSVAADPVKRLTTGSGIGSLKGRALLKYLAKFGVPGAILGGGIGAALGSQSSTWERRSYLGDDH